MLYGTHFMIGAAYTLAMQGHIRTDFLSRVARPLAGHSRLHFIHLLILPSVGALVLCRI